MARDSQKSVTAILMLAAMTASIAVANDPALVSNVDAFQRDDGSGIVDIFYDLADPDGDPCVVTVEASEDGGAMWTVPITAVTGAVGGGIMPGSDKHVVWESATDLPGAFGSHYEVRVCADDGQGPGGDMVLIPAGSFQMGDTFDEGSSNELPVHSVYVSDLYVGAHEVTNEQYAAGLNWALAQGLLNVSGGVVYRAGGTSIPYCDTNSARSDSCIVWTGSTFTVESGRDDQPMVEVSWYGSVAYCNWRSSMEGRTPCYDTSTWTCNFGANGYRLPTEAEWEKAGRGSLTGQRFPWGDTINHAYANYRACGTCYPYDDSPYSDYTYHPDFDDGGYPYTSPVGYFASNDYGVHDAAGNVWEWCNDWYSSSYYSSSPGSNPTGPGSGTSRVFRGGSWTVYASHCRVAHRAHSTPDDRDHSYGFRICTTVHPEWQPSSGFVRDTAQVWEGGLAASDVAVYFAGQGLTMIGQLGLAGGILEWTEGPSQDYEDPAIIVYGSHLYCVGGEYTTDVKYAAINANGTIGDWQSTSSLAIGTARAPIVAYHNRLYSIGGASDAHSFPQVVQVAEVLPDGSLGPWVVSTSDLNYSHPASAAVVHDGHLYVFGGGQHDYLTGTVERCPISSDGTLGEWVLDQELPIGRNSHGAVLVDDRVYLVGGSLGTYGQNRTNTVISARICDDHTLTGWEMETPLPYQPSNHRHAAVFADGWMYAFGNGDPVDVFYAFGGSPLCTESPPFTVDNRIPAPGDMNCDGIVTAADIDPFVLALTDPPGYLATFPDCLLMNGDLNGDEYVTAADIDPFVMLLTGN
jgi:sulfatase modifying factor 1